MPRFMRRRHRDLRLPVGDVDAEEARIKAEGMARSRKWAPYMRPLAVFGFAFFVLLVFGQARFWPPITLAIGVCSAIINIAAAVAIVKGSRAAPKVARELRSRGGLSGAVGAGFFALVSLALVVLIRP